jgi:hypothetical protein
MIVDDPHLVHENGSETVPRRLVPHYDQVPLAASLHSVDGLLRGDQVWNGGADRDEDFEPGPVPQW